MEKNGLAGEWKGRYGKRFKWAREATTRGRVELGTFLPDRAQRQKMAGLKRSRESKQRRTRQEARTQRQPTRNYFS